MNKEKKITILEHEINYYSKVYPKCSKLKKLKLELKKLKRGIYV